MTVHVHLIHETPLKLWGLTARERLRRVLERAGIANLSDDLAKISDPDTVLLLRGDHLYDNRIVTKLIATTNVALRPEAGKAVVAAHVPASQAQRACQLLSGTLTVDALPDISLEDAGSLGSGYNAKLRKFEDPLLLPIEADNRVELERRLFDGAYKGITDLITKWVWPLPARWVTGICAHSGIRPNHVTSLSWVLAIVAGFLFAYGYYGWGLVIGWLMTFLDTVDGKLARVTVTYTKFGDLFDHILDLVHPPLWYLAWGMGLAAFSPVIPGLTVDLAVWLIFIGYVLGRLVEGAFSAWIGKFSLFTWQRTDSYARLIIARRNPCLVLLTIGALFGRPDLGLVAVTVWTLLSTLFLLLRLVMAWRARRASGSLHSWLAEIDEISPDDSLAVRWFAR